MDRIPCSSHTFSLFLSSYKYCHALLNRVGIFSFASVLNIYLNRRVPETKFKNNFMLSLDVSSLFTNIPLQETVDFICNELTERRIETPIPASAIKQLILRCTMNAQFRFDNEYYRQLDGIAMRSPLGPLVADIFLAKLENGPLKSIISHLPTYYRYIDDTFIVLEKENDKDNLLNTFNNVHPSINFTSEDEQNDSISFLDVQLKRRADGTLKRGVHRKSAAGQYTHFYSAVPIRYKRNLIKILTHRARMICSEDTIEEELNNIRNLLSMNGYPMKFIDKHMMEKKTRTKIPTVHKKVLFIKLQFINDTIEETLTQKLRRAVKKTFNAARLNAIFYNYPKIRTANKDRLPEFAKSMCIYRFNCSCGASYIGRTIRQVRHRITEHHPSWLNKGQVKVIKSSILSHLVDTGHQVELNEAFKVIYNIPSNLPHGLRVRLLHIAEAIAIHVHKPDLCIQKRFVQPLSLPWPSV
ncbi:Alpha-(1,6)-fucosyltransferase [Schistosoma haematobium]|uniref:Alpha-(1,6)-fucosyltransferase n=1 Tax=Schistosoma haematobium TaxID=6185 RepID=A0A922S3B3_SCHHA|nr:Alpha-(1,6)-fucosyltransferase [Schistosoma haematobium]KAH9591590.1 Alpha-(1,6)-fucosyltransferase [Schistosoma haematobium]